MRRGSEVKSRIGIGTFLTMYSLTASMLYFNCAEMGTMGDFSAIVPNTKQWLAFGFLATQDCYLSRMQ